MRVLDNFISILGFVVRQRKIPNIITPKSLTEKILKIKVSSSGGDAELRKLVSDRVKVRDYVEKKSPECKTIDLLWHGTDFNEGIWNDLPVRFVIKANHGSKMVKIVDKGKDNFIDVKNITKDWLNTDYYKKGREWVYKDIERVLVVESFLSFDGDVPPDYKFFCLNGKVAFVQVDLDRYNGHSRNIYDRDFNLLDVNYHFPKGYIIEKHERFDDALNVAEDLAVDFDFIRVDLYLVKDGIYFGELTNFPGNCLESFSDYKFDLDMGSKLVLGNG